MFKNPEIALDTLPAVEQLDWQDLHPNYQRCLRVQRSMLLVAVGVVIIATKFILSIPVLQTGIVLAILVIPAVVLLTWPAISIPRRGYVVRDKDIVFRSGVLWRSVTAIPFNRIQHVETSSTPLDRQFNISTLQLFTAGGSKGDLKINGLGKDVAEQLRVFILKKVGISIESA